MATETEQTDEQFEDVLAQLAHEYQLDLHMLGSLGEFHVTHAAAAEWVVKKITATAMEIQRVTDQFQAMIRELERRRDWLHLRFDTELERFTADALAGQKKRSLRLPHGTCGFRRLPEGMTIYDKDRAIAAAEASVPEAVKIEKRLVKTPLLDHFKATGEVLDGCEHRPGRDKFYVK